MPNPTESSNFARNKKCIIMIKQLLLSAAMAGCLTAQAASDDTLVLQYTSGLEESITLSDFTTATFGDGTLTFNGLGKTINLADLHKFFFRQAATGIKAINSQEEAGTKPAEWYTLEGLRIAQPQKAGTYILKQGNTTRKVLIGKP